MRSCLIFLMISLLYCTSCNLDSKEISAKELKGDLLEGSTLVKYFSPEVVSIVAEIKSIFDKGLMEGNENYNLDETYSFHAQSMREYIFNEVPHEVMYPFNGKFSLSKISESKLQKLPFLTRKCGFQKEDGEIINYYCFSVNKEYFAYLNQLGENAPLIQQFTRSYEQTKSLNAEIRQGILFGAKEQLNFSNIDHQIFYMFFYIIDNEERQASKKI